MNNRHIRTTNKKNVPTWIRPVWRSVPSADAKGTIAAFEMGDCVVCACDLLCYYPIVDWSRREFKYHTSRHIKLCFLLRIFQFRGRGFNSRCHWFMPTAYPKGFFHSGNYFGVYCLCSYVYSSIKSSLTIQDVRAMIPRNSICGTMIVWTRFIGLKDCRIICLELGFSQDLQDYQDCFLT